VGDFYKKTIRNTDLNGKTVLIRADFNVPLNAHGVISDDYRIRKTLPTIEYARSKGAKKIIIIAHLGRPKGAVNQEFSLKPVATKLKELLHLDVHFAEDCIGEVANKAKQELPDRGILLLENLRFHYEEEANDDKFAKHLAENIDVFIQDGFGIVHRAHASTDAITRHLPSVAGILLEKEVSTITKAIEHPHKPLAVIIGGAKIADKIDLLDRFIEKADFIAVVGAMANTFLLAEGIKVGKSVVDKDSVKDAKEILEKAHQKYLKGHFNLYLPQDVVVSKGIEYKYATRVVDIDHHTWADINSYPKHPTKHSYTVADDELILDIG
jgi:3-phosphoglycerate kinase